MGWKPQRMLGCTCPPHVSAKLEKLSHLAGTLWVGSSQWMESPFQAGVSVSRKMGTEASLVWVFGTVLSCAWFESRAGIELRS